MGRKNKGGFIIDNLEIIDYANEGKAIGKVDGKVIFVPGAMPGDVVDVRITFNKKDFSEGRIINFIKKSENRVEPPCRHFTYCGGCKWQHVPYDQQLRFKQRMVEETLQRIGKAQVKEWLPIIGSDKEYYYRNKLEFTFSAVSWLPNEMLATAHLQNKPVLGYHVQGFWDKVLHIEECLLQPEPTNAIRRAVYQYTIENNYSFYHPRQQVGLMRNIMIRVARSGEVMVLVVFRDNDEDKINSLLDFMKKEFPQITSLNYVVNSKKNDTIYDLQVLCYHGSEVIYEELDGLKFSISPQSFFQTNTSQAEKLYRVVKDFAGLKGDELMYDLYSGTGSIAIYLAGSCKKVIGLENVVSATVDAEKNAVLNNIKNTEFYTADIAEALTSGFAAEHGVPDVVITDPPRAGMHPLVVQSLMGLLPKRIVYVSCNPATQARDIEVLSEAYDILKSQPVDMFPQTHHLENVMLLERKGSPGPT